MLHKHAQTDVVGEDGLARGRVGGVVGDRRVQHRQQEACLGLVLVADDVARHGEAVVHDHLGVVLRSLQQVAEVDVLLLVLIALLFPRRNGLTVEHDHVEECVQEKDRVGAHRGGVQQHWLRRAVEGVRQQRGLQHNQRVGRVLTGQNVAIHGLLVRRGVKALQELGSAQVKHELRVNTEFLGQTEARCVVFAVVSKLGGQADQGAIQPSLHVRDVLGEAAVHGQARHQHGGCFLVEGGRNRGMIRGIAVPAAAHSCHAQVEAAVGGLVSGQELHEAALVGRQRCGVGVGHFEEESDRGGGIYTTQVPQ